MNKRLNIVFCQIRLQVFTILSTYNKQMKDMAVRILIHYNRQFYGRISYTFHISPSYSFTNVVTFVNILQFYRKKSCLHLIHPAIQSCITMNITHYRSVIGQCSYNMSQLLIICSDSPTVTQRTQIFTWIKTKSSRVTQVTCVDAMPFCTDSLSIVFYYFQIIFLFQFIQFIRPTGLTV